MEARLLGKNSTIRKDDGCASTSMQQNKQKSFECVNTVEVGKNTDTTITNRRLDLNDCRRS